MPERIDPLRDRSPDRDPIEPTSNRDVVQPESSTRSLQQPTFPDRGDINDNSVVTQLDQRLSTEPQAQLAQEDQRGQLAPVLEDPGNQPLSVESPNTSYQREIDRDVPKTPMRTDRRTQFSRHDDIRHFTDDAAIFVNWIMDRHVAWADPTTIEHATADEIHTRFAIPRPYDIENGHVLPKGTFGLLQTQLFYETENLNRYPWGRPAHALRTHMRQMIDGDDFYEAFYRQAAFLLIGIEEWYHQFKHKDTLPDNIMEWPLPRQKLRAITLLTSRDPY